MSESIKIKHDLTQVITFWFNLTPSQWWQTGESVDQYIQQHFADTHRAATQGELAAWRQTATGRLAEIIVLDQFSRNLYRHNPLAFAFDGMALALSQEAVNAGCLDALNTTQQPFLIMPFMHSESRIIHEQATKLFARPGLENSYKFEGKHKAIIDRFGRYPHRNEVLGRTSTVVEEEFLQQPGSSF